MHCRLLGRPARMAALEKFIKYASSHNKVWFSRRVDIARHWHETHPYKAGESK
jgi:peptidoglycan/xylan/chitin deacetylase (PgdA/CDA1 family)